MSYNSPWFVDFPLEYKVMSNVSPSPAGTPATSTNTRLLHLIGYILGISYPLLALSTGTRGLYQIWFRPDITNKLGPILSSVAGVLYVIAALGFFKRTPRWWRVSVIVLAIETVFVVVIGALSFLRPDLISHTSWWHFGQEYAFFPLFQPILGLIYLLSRPARQTFHLERAG